MVKLQSGIVQSAGTVEYTNWFSADPPPTSVLDYDNKQSDGNTETLEDAEYPFIAIPPWSTLSQIGSTW